MTKEERKAIVIIRNYLNNPKLTDEYILDNYDLAIESIIENSKQLGSIKAPGVKSMSEGKQSITFETGAEAWSITEDVAALLPLPYLRIF
ncbi:hypothetical protein [Clostridium sp.]|uniref:hypothetical protein n=1 Tax=Clostridium sp. TaxID=1506 RepID=UPI0032177498